MYTIRPNLIRPRVTLRAKKDDFIAPTEAPGEGKRRPPTWDEGDESEKGGVNPIKKFIMKIFNVEEIDHEKFRESNKWAIKPRPRRRE